jgi:multiple sugar transport system substrate-binding protein
MRHLNRRHMLRGAVLLGAGATGLTALAACDDGDEPGNGEPGTLRLAWWGNPVRDENTENAVRLFEEATGRTVQLEAANWTDYWPALSTQIAGGNPPDLMQHDYQFIAEYARDNALLALDDYVPSGLDLADIPEDAVDSGRVDGTLYAVPWGFNTFALVSNQRVLADGGAEQPDNTLTWSQFFDLAVQVGENTPDGVWGAPNAMGLKEALECWLHQRGKALFTADGQFGYEPADLQEWYEYWTELVEAGGCMDAETAGELLGGLEDSEVVTGLAAFNFHWSNIIPAVIGRTADPVGLSMYPQGDPPNTQPGQYNKASMYLAVPAQAGDPDGAVDLLAALVLDPDIAREIGFERGLPASDVVQQALLPDAGEGELAMIDFVNSVQDELRPVPPPPPPAGPQVDEEFGFYAEQVGFGQMSPADAAEAFFDAASGHLG